MNWEKLPHIIDNPVVFFQDSLREFQAGGKQIDAASAWIMASYPAVFNANHEIIEWRAK